MKPKMLVLPGFWPVLIDAHATGDSAGLLEPSGAKVPPFASFAQWGILCSSMNWRTSWKPAPSKPRITTRGPAAAALGPPSPGSPPRQIPAEKRPSATRPATHPLHARRIIDEAPGPSAAGIAAQLARPGSRRSDLFETRAAQGKG